MSPLKALFFIITISLFPFSPLLSTLHVKIYQFFSFFSTSKCHGVTSKGGRVEKDGRDVGEKAQAWEDAGKKREVTGGW